MKNQPDLNNILSSPQAAGLLKNRQAIESLMKSGEAQRLMELLNQNAGGELKGARAIGHERGLLTADESGGGPDEKPSER